MHIYACARTALLGPAVCSQIVSRPRDVRASVRTGVRASVRTGVRTYRRTCVRTHQRTGVRTYQRTGVRTYQPTDEPHDGNYNVRYERCKKSVVRRLDCDRILWLSVQNDVLHNKLEKASKRKQR